MFINYQIIFLNKENAEMYIFFFLKKSIFVQKNVKETFKNSC